MSKRSKQTAIGLSFLTVLIVGALTMLSVFSTNLPGREVHNAQHLPPNQFRAIAIGS